MKKTIKKGASALLATVMTITSLSGFGFTTASAAESLPSSLTQISKEGVAARIGVFSDVHITKNNGEDATKNPAAKSLDKALTTYDAQKVDGLAMNGDIVYQVNKTWSSSGADDLSDVPYKMLKEVLSNHGYFDLETNTMPDNVVYSTGNHEFPQSNDNAEVGQKAIELFQTEMDTEIRTDKKVNGFHLITAGGVSYNSTMTAETKQWVLDKIDAAHAEDSSKPVFLFVHHPIHDTVVYSDTEANSKYGAEFKAELNKRPYVIVFTAHNHIPGQNPLAIWQDGFTVIHSPLVAGGNITFDPNVSAALVPNYNGVVSSDYSSQGMMVDVSNENVVTVYRFNFTSNEVVGEPYVIDISAGADGFKYKNRTPQTPYFEENATLTTNEVGDNNIKITFPAAEVGAENGTSEGYVSKYKIEAIDKTYDFVSFSKSYTSDYYRSPSNRQSSFTANITGLDPAEEYLIKVTPISCLGGEGTPLEITAKTTGTKPARECIKKEVNVALNKSVSTSATNSYPERANDGDLSTCWYPQGTRESGEKNSWWTVDLGREYNIKRIEIYDQGQDWEQHRNDIVVEGSQSADFSNKVVIDSITGGADNEKYPKKGCWQIGSLETPFRYIRIRKVNSQFYCPYITEVKVFADVTLTEILTGKPAYASSVPYTQYSEKMANDGNLNTEWLSYSGEYPYWFADLGAKYYIDYMEFYTRGENEARRFIDVFGSNEKVTADTDFDSLHKFLSYGSDKFISTDGYSGGVNSPEAYRYIGFRKTYNYGTSSIKEIKAYTLSPDVNNITLSNSGAVIRFSEEMDSSTLNPDEIKIYDMQAGAEVAYTDYSYSGLEYKINVPLEIARTYKVSVSSNVASKKNATMPDTYSETIVNGELPTYDDDLNQKKVLVNVAQFKLVEASTVGYSDGLNDPECANDGIVDNKKWNPGGTFKNSNSRVWWKVDLGRDYNVESIEIYDDGNGWDFHRKNLVVEGAQNSDFSDAVTLDSIINTVDNTKYPQNGCWKINVKSTTPMRYVRIRRTDAQVWCPYIREIKVFAEQTVTEVSAGKTAVSSCDNTEYVASNANDANRNSLWKDTNTSAHKAWWKADLESPYYIEYFEIDDSSDFKGTRRSFEIKGSNSDENTGTTVENAKKLAYLGNGQNLHSLQSDPFPQGGSWQSAANCDVPYRYLIWSTSGNVTEAAIADIRAYVVNPEIYDMEVKNDKITLTFSDEMLSSTLSNETVKIYDDQKTEVAYSDYTASGKTYTINNLSLADGKAYSIVVTDDARNTKLVPVAKADNTRDFVCGASFETEYLKLGELTNGGTLSASSVVKNNTDTDTEASIIVALYKGGTLYSIKVEDCTLTANAKTKLSASISLPETDIEKYNAKAFVWKKANNVPLSEAAVK